ncbi:MAG: InlB B-repeat-containing protein [Clostridia bacterium]|nr:InlB B-repeat-containing protein [Clostridia bacterium]
MRQIKRLLPVFLVCAIAVCMAFAVACTKKYTVTFDSDGGKEVASQTVNNGQKAEKPEDPTKANYEFDGWFLGESEYDFETSVTADITLKAHWTRLYAVKFNTDGGNTIAPTTAREGETVTKPADPTKTGYGFDGWYNGETAYNFTETVTGDVTLTAHWTLNVYDVTFNVDGGSEVAAIKVNHGSSFAQPATEKWGYDFAGWYNGETVYEGGAVTGNLTLTAHWTAWQNWTDESKTQLSDIVIDTTAVKKAYNIGERLNTEGIKVCLVSVDEAGVASNYNVSTENAVVDSSEFNTNKEGTYTIYLSYTHDGITRHASYEVTVTSVISGVHGIELVKQTTEYDVTVGGNEPVALDLDDIKVYLANEDGTRGAELTEGVTVKYYYGNQEIESTELTTRYARVYQIWASVNYTVGTETYVMSDFVLVKVNGNNITKMEFVSEGAIITQPQSYTDMMSSTWKFNVEYRLGQKETIDLSTAEYGTGDNQYTLKYFTPSVVGAGGATLTYHYAVGAEIWEYSAFVPYLITEPKESSTFKAVIDVNVGTDDLYKDTATHVITKTLSAGDEIVPYMVYVATGSGLATNSENKYDANYEDNQNRLYGRVQFAGARGITLYLAGPATITLKARLGSGSAYKFQLKWGDTVVAESEDITNSKKYETVTIEVEKAGVYDLYATGSLNTFAIEIEGTIKGKAAEPKISTDLTNVEAKSYAANENVTLGSETFTLMGGGSVAVDSTSATVAGVTFDKIMKLGGSKSGSNTQRTIKIEITADMVANGDVTVLVYAVSGNTSSERNLALFTGENGATKLSQNGVSTAALLTYTIETAGTYYLGSAGSGINVYGVSLAYDDGGIII